MRRAAIGVLSALCAAGAWAEGEIRDPAAIRQLRLEAIRKITDFALIPAKVLCPPPEVYSRAYLGYAMNAGLAVTRGGRLWATAIPGEDGPRGFQAAWYSDDRGETWSDTAFVIDPHDPVYFPGIPRFSLQGTLWVDPDGRLHCLYQQSMGLYDSDYHGTSSADGRMGVWDAVCDNPDDAHPRWKEPRRICDGIINNKPLVLKDGTWLLPSCIGVGGGFYDGVYPELKERHAAVWFASTDKGRTWERRGSLKARGGVWYEHMAVELQDGRLRMFARVNRKGEPRGLVESYSSDKGWTWSEATEPKDVNGPCSRFHFRRLRSGNIIFVKHGDTMDDFNRGWRCNTRVFLSKDDGKTWLGGLQIEAQGGSYPDCDQAADGTIYVTLDHGRDKWAEIRLARFTEADIEAGKLVTPGSKTWMLVMKALRCPAPRRLTGGKRLCDSRLAPALPLPGEPCTKPALALADEERLARYVTANWQAFPLGEIARVVGADPQAIAKVAAKRGLGAQPAEFPKRDAATNAATIRANWELLPYEQLLPLLGMNRQELAAVLTEDGLFAELGGYKPKCNWLIEGSAVK